MRRRSITEITAEIALDLDLIMVRLGEGGYEGCGE